MGKVIKVDFTLCFIYIWDPLLSCFIYAKEIRGIKRAKKYMGKIEEKTNRETKLIFYADTDTSI